MNALSDLEFLILDEVYFVSSYHTVLENVRVREEEFRIVLAGLLEKGLISQMRYSERAKDFERLERPDLSAFNDSWFVVTREGLLVHNSRN